MLLFNVKFANVKQLFAAGIVQLCYCRGPIKRNKLHCARIIFMNVVNSYSAPGLRIRTVSHIVDNVNFESALLKIESNMETSLGKAKKCIERHILKAIHVGKVSASVNKSAPTKF